MSLVISAVNKSLPAQQYMDLETLEWIKENNPFKSKVCLPLALQLEAKNYVKKYIPSTEWFINPERAKTIHGKRHLLRVGLYTFLLMMQLNLVRDLDVCIIIGVLHDIRRETDQSDEGHALRSADWFIEKVEDITSKFQVNLSAIDIEKIYNGILFHELPYEKIDPNFLNKYKKIINIIKTSDALDRYLQPKLKWWINDELLVIKPPVDLKQFAFELILKSEENFINNKELEDSIFNSFPV